MPAIQITPILTLLVQIATILLLSRVMGWLMRLIGQPQVIGEMAAGIMLGPSVLGLLDGGKWVHLLFPEESLGNLNLLSQLGVMLFMFLVGLELDPKLLRGQGRAVMATGTVGVFIPMAGGIVLGLALVHWAGDITGATGSTLVFCLFMGTSMCITAFPVLARILTERNLHRTKSGVLALTCAAMDDAMGWCLLAFVLAVAHVKGFGSDAAAHAAQAGPLVTVTTTIGLAGAFVAVMIFGVRRFLTGLRRHYESRGYLSQDVLAVVFLLLIACSIATDLIGIHQIFGAFVLGAVMPKDGAFIRHLSEKVEDFAVLFLLPLFFAYTGLRTELGLLGGSRDWIICGIVIATAVAGKFGGVALAGRWNGMDWRKSSLLGILMNTRGLMELIVLNIGLNYGVLSKPVFAMMVLMALVTTFMTAPLMLLLYSPARQRKELEEAALSDSGKPAGVHVVVPVGLRTSVAPLVKMATMLMGREAGRLYGLHLDRPEELELRAKGVLAESDEILRAATSVARGANVPITTVSFVSRNFGRDIAESVRKYQASWLVMGWHKPIFFKRLLGGTVGQVLELAPANVAVLFEKGWDGRSDLKRILVPYIGERQDRGALLAAERLGRLPGVEITVIHVVKPNRVGADARLGVQEEVAREFPETSGQESVRVKIIESESPADVVIEESYRFDLMVLGLASQRNGQSDEWNGRHENIAQLSNCAILIVHANPGAATMQNRMMPAHETAGKK